LNDITSNKATDPENALIIYDLNVEKSKAKTTYIPTLFQIDDYVREKETKIFAKKSEGTYKDEVH